MPELDVPDIETPAPTPPPAPSVVARALDSVTDALDHGEDRPGQRTMAVAVAEAIATKRHLIVQAGTGTGKSLAYLVPTILSGRRTVIATATKNLQDQLACVSPQTKILTADLRHVPAGDIYVGQELVGFDEQPMEGDGLGLRRRYRRSVVESVRRITKPCYRLEFDDGTTVVCSTDHQWLTKQSMNVKWMTASQMRPTAGKRPGSCAIRLSDVWIPESSWEAGYLAGVYDGEGCLGQRRAAAAGGHYNSLTFSQRDNECFKRAASILDDHLIDWRNHRREHEGHDEWDPVNVIHISKRTDIMRVLGQFRPERLLAKFDPEMLGTIPTIRQGKPHGQRLLRKTFVGDQEVVLVQTSTKTFIAEGLASHNCKDLPFLQEHLDRPFSFAVLKGRSNYLCRQRLHEATTSDSQLDLELNPGADDASADRRGRELAELTAWAAETPTGDRAELATEPSFGTWAAVSVGPRECPGATKCPQGESCFAEQARGRAADADIVIVNLHLYGLDVATGGGVLPEHDVVVIDEAHQLEDTVSATAGIELSPGRFSALASTVAAIVADPDLTAALEKSADTVGEALSEHIGRRLRGAAPPELVTALVSGRLRIDAALKALRAIPDSAAGGDTAARKQRAMKAATSLADDLESVTNLSSSTKVAWVEGFADAPVLKVAPLDVAPVLADALWERRTAILTSATIPVNLAASLGLQDDDHDELDVGSPFPYGANALLYCAAHLPDPRTAGFDEALQQELEALIVAAGGRTLALFTSFRAMDAAADALRTRLPWTVMTQRELPKPVLLQRFTDDETSCLFATLGFWQGVDVPGPALSLVTIDRLPFPRPDEPLLQARREQARAAAFRVVDLPRATTLLAQGAGRLVRRSSDRGVVAVLDPRLATKARYRWEIIRALPPMHRTKDRAEAEKFLRDLRDARPADT